jgi:hypothetical protein
VNVSLEALDVTWLAGQAALEISVPQGLRYETNDIGGKSHRKLATLRLPHLSMKVYLTAASRRQTWLEAAEFTADTYLDVYYSPPGWVEKARAQAEFVHTQSGPTGRSMHMFEAFNTDDALPREYLIKVLLRVTCLNSISQIVFYTRVVCTSHSRDCRITQASALCICGQGNTGVEQNCQPSSHVPGLYYLT